MFISYITQYLEIHGSRRFNETLLLVFCSFSDGWHSVDEMTLLKFNSILWTKGRKAGYIWLYLSSVSHYLHYLIIRIWDAVTFQFFSREQKLIPKQPPFQPHCIALTYTGNTKRIIYQNWETIIHLYVPQFVI